MKTFIQLLMDASIHVDTGKFFELFDRKDGNYSLKIYLSPTPELIDVARGSFYSEKEEGTRHDFYVYVNSEEDSNGDRIYAICCDEYTSNHELEGACILELDWPDRRYIYECINKQCIKYLKKDIPTIIKESLRILNDIM